MDFKGFYDEIIFDVDKPILKSYTGKQGDTKSRGLYVTVTQKNAVIDDLTGLSMTFYCEKPDKTRVYQDAIKDGNRFRVDLANQVFAVPGILDCELTLKGANGERITSKTFKMRVDRSLVDNSIVSEDERGVIDDALEFVEEYVPRLELIDIDSLENYDSELKQNKVKISTVEKELNDYKATMQQVNINQEPKQKAAGYRVISLPPNAAEGQVSSARIQGLTATNLAKNGNFANGTDGWGFSNSTLSAKDNTLIVTARDAYRYGQAIQAVNDRIIGHKYYGKAKVRVTNNDCEQLDLNIAGIRESVVSPSANQWYTISAHGVATSEGALIVITQMYETAEIAKGKIMELQEVMAIDLTATFGAGNEPTKEECDKIFANWFDGTKSTVGAIRIKSVGKNLLNLSNGQQTINGITIVVDDGEVLINGTTTSNVWIKLTGGFEATSSRPSHWINDSLRIKPGNYTLSRNSISGTGTSMTLAIRNQNDEMAIGMTQTTNSETGFLDDNLSYVYLFIASGAVFNNYRFRPQLEIGEKATDYESYKESNAYVIAKDEEGNILELRSLPNGTKDEIRVSEGKLIKRVSDVVDLSKIEWVEYVDGHTANYYAASYQSPIVWRNPRYLNYNGSRFGVTTEFNQVDNLAYFYAGITTIRIKIPKTAYAGSWTLSETKTWLQNNQIALIYQLAEPIEIPIQVSGTLTSYPNGTIIVLRELPDAGIYTDKMEILHRDAPIKRLDKLSKVDFTTGVETELDISQAEISEDKLSFTHPELNAGDIVFFEYEYDVESTDGEAEVEYYDSRYVVKDDVTGKFYKWNVKVSNGTPTIEVVEV